MSEGRSLSQILSYIRYNPPQLMPHYGVQTEIRAMWLFSTATRAGRGCVGAPIHSTQHTAPEKYQFR